MEDLLTYDTINNPYGPLLTRSNTVTPVAPSDTTNDDINLVSSGREVQTGQALSYVWIDTWIKSRSYSPKKRGFYIDGQTGYAEFTNVFVSGEVDATSGTIGGWVIGPTTLVGGNITLDSSGNIQLYENTTTNGSTISGSFAEIKLIKLTDNTQYFTIRKRVGLTSNSNNVLELFSSAPIAGGYNIMSFGKSADLSNYNTGVITFNINTKSGSFVSGANGAFSVQTTTDGISNGNILLIEDSRIYYNDSSKVGFVSMMVGQGTDGIAGIGHISAGGMTFWQTTSSLISRTNILPFATSTYDLGSVSYLFNNSFINNIYTHNIFSDNIIIYNGGVQVGEFYYGTYGPTVEAKSGNSLILSTNNDTYPIYFVFSGSPTLSLFHDVMVPASANVYDLGSVSNYFKNIYCSGLSAGTVVVSTKFKLPVGTNLY